VRLFVAVEIDAAVLARLGDLSETLQRRASEQSRDARITWVPPERMHLTVRFIGEADDSRAAAIADALTPRVGTEVFDVRIGGIGVFPLRGAPRVIWAGIEAGLEELHQLEHEVTARLAACGVPPEDREYRPHLSLARVREAGGLRSRALLDGLAGTLGTTRVEAITLFQSKLSPKGPTYMPLQRTPLGRPEGRPLQ
jgi:2'-5' RNA ligase